MPDDISLDRVIAEAWPPRFEETIDGWARRLTDGVTRRANSALVSGRPANIDAAIDGVESFYRDAQRPTVFLVSEQVSPPEVVSHLIARGYEPTSPTWVLTRLGVPHEGGGRWVTVAAPDFDEEWLTAYRDGGGLAAETATLREVLLRPAHPAVFVTVRSDDGAVAAVGQVVVVDGHGCVQCLVTVPAARRRGAGRVVVEQLMAEAGALGAKSMLAAVMVDNSASLGLFEQLGFERSHRYSYYRANSVQ